mmetsp:Transcript_95873/g.213252  ORF Transcript_95873/g.213252 Transcript_95873/m.213252 type:complete len:340 (+) Transcript_95873:173-1192(+)
MEHTGALRHIHSHTSDFSVQHSQCGFLFDVTAKSHDIAICAVSFMPGTMDGDYDIWTAPETHELVHQNAKAWTLVAKATHLGPRGAKLRIPLPRYVEVPKTQRHAFYISGHNVNAVCFSTESQHNNSAENEDLILHLGHFKAFPWEGVLSTGPFGHNGMQEFVGDLEYQVLQPIEADHVVATTERLWETRPFPDAELMASGGETFPVHRAVLAAASLEFEEAWRRLPMGEELPVLKVEANADTVESLLHFMYTGYYNENSDPGEMIRLAHLYGLSVLVKGSATRLANCLCTDNAVATVKALRPYRAHPACEAAWHMLLTNVQELLTKDRHLLEEVLLAM